MNATTQPISEHHVHSNSFKWIASSSVMEAIVAIAIVALSIVGLAGVNSLLMAAIATIIAGAAVLLEGGVFSKELHSNTAEAPARGGLSAAFLGALAGIILGVLALMNVAPITLLSVAVLVFGVTFLLSSQSERSSFTGRMDGLMLLGLSVAILGLLAVIGISSIWLVLVGLLILGSASLIGGSIKSLV
ncbi:MAG TPA: hypothetical protein VKY92_02040 [Verrucomicrobiae bacterium]|jgi:hypothetical protein|nr:hypothetical protein [Verrucomicrobiae bacterium]